MKVLVTILFSVLTLQLFASELSISNPILYIESDETYAVVNVSWKNAWFTEKNHDGIWLFCKSVFNDGGYRHINVSPNNHQVVQNFASDFNGFDFKVSKDGTGLLLHPNAAFRGNVSLTIKISLDADSFDGINTRNQSFTIYGVEMVSIPSGSFYIGDKSPKARELGSFFNPTNPTDITQVKKESKKLIVGEKGDIYYSANEGYEGDQTGTIPAEYPKGVDDFIIMKYEVTEGLYVDFLNSLTPTQQQARNIVDENNYIGSIEVTEDAFSSRYSTRPCPFLSWSDAMAIADWAGLRPMSEFEFTKASRGTDASATLDFPWGSSEKAQIQRMPNEKGELTMRNGWSESELNESTKQYFGASYYWVMDLAGSLWERVVSVGHENGRAFKGSHGDGTLSPEGYSNNEDWPSGDEEAGGVGFRGGGFYGYDREYHEFNPFSPVSYRPYGGWHGTMRHKAYGTRFVRTFN